MENLNAAKAIALLLCIIGAVNWGLFGLFNIDLVALLFGALSSISRAVYILVGMAGIYLAAHFPHLARN